MKQQQWQYPLRFNTKFYDMADVVFAVTVPCEQHMRPFDIVLVVVTKYKAHLLE